MYCTRTLRSVCIFRNLSLNYLLQLVIGIPGKKLESFCLFFIVVYHKPNYLGSNEKTIHQRGVAFHGACRKVTPKVLLDALESYVKTVSESFFFVV